jgi:hypothetical protein
VPFLIRHHFGIENFQIKNLFLVGVQHFKNPPHQIYFHDKSNIKEMYYYIEILKLNLFLKNTNTGVEACDIGTNV